MAKKKNSWGGKRKGAGRPVGSVGEFNPHARRRRVAIMLSNIEYALLEQKAGNLGEPVATVAYKSVRRGLRK